MKGKLQILVLLRNTNDSQRRKSIEVWCKEEKAGRINGPEKKLQFSFGRKKRC